MPYKTVFTKCSDGQTSWLEPTQEWVDPTPEEATAAAEAKSRDESIRADLTRKTEKLIAAMKALDDDPGTAT